MIEKRNEKFHQKRRKKEGKKGKIFCFVFLKRKKEKRENSTKKMNGIWIDNFWEKETMKKILFAKRKKLDRYISQISNNVIYNIKIRKKDIFS